MPITSLIEANEAGTSKSFQEVIFYIRKNTASPNSNLLFEFSSHLWMWQVTSVPLPPQFRSISSGYNLSKLITIFCQDLISYIYIYIYIYFFFWRCGPTRAMASSFTRFLDHTQRSTTIGRTSLDEWSACRRDLYLTTHNTHNRQTSMPRVGFEPTILAGDSDIPYPHAFCPFVAVCWLDASNYPLYKKCSDTELSS